MKLKILGSGTSTGVPLLGCSCPVCTSTDERDKRLRSSVFIEQDNFHLLIDSGPDIRHQLLREQITQMDALLLTHIHYDHIGGIDDLRPLSQKHADGLNCYGDAFTCESALRLHPHIQNWKKIKNLPRLNFLSLEISANGSFLPFSLGPFTIQPIRQMHIPNINFYSTGFVINKKIAYLTDFKYIIEADKHHLFDLDVMILGTPLMFAHSNHISIPEGIELLKFFRAKQGYLTHLSHNISHHELQQKIKEEFNATNFFPAYDGLEIVVK